MLLICVPLLFASVLSQSIPQPFGFGMFPYSGPNGFFTTHPGYGTNFPYYATGIQNRYVVRVPQGQLAQITIDTTDQRFFRIRNFDFAVIYDGAQVNKVTANPCQVATYVALGSAGPTSDYLPVTNTSASVLTFTSRTNVSIIDFCVSGYFTSSNDPTMLGFRVFWSGVNASPPGPTCALQAVAPSANQNVLKIIGGANATARSWPSICALVKNSAGSGVPPYQFCGCTVISSQWIMTAGHCTSTDGATDPYLKQNVKIYMGVTDLTLATSNNIRGIATVVRHPQYDVPLGTQNNDITLIKLDSPIAASQSLTPACLPSQAIDTFKAGLPIGTKGRRICYVAGWGTLTAGQMPSLTLIGSGSNQLKQTSIEVFSMADCKNDGLVLTNMMICGGYDKGGYDSCQGDSGGPMMCDQGDGTWAVFGIVSWGLGCGEAGEPGVYTNVYNLKPWILQTLASN